MPEQAAQPLVALLPLQLVERGLESLRRHVVHRTGQPLPAGLFRDVHDPAGRVTGRFVGLLLGFLTRGTRRHLLGDDAVACGLELVVRPLQEEQHQQEVAVLGGIHGSAQDVGRREEVALQLIERELGHVRAPWWWSEYWRGAGCVPRPAWVAYVDAA